MKNKKGIILLSGGLDSLVSLFAAKKVCDIKIALTFNYGQRALREEIEASKKIAQKYDIEHKIIDLPFLCEVTHNALTENDRNLEFKALDKNSAKAVWVPNRNGLFLNMAACYCDAQDLDYIIFGANKEEAATFSDNSEEFIKTADEFFKLSTDKKPIILAPMAKFYKFEIINYALDNNVDLSLLKSCYNSSEISGKKHCGVCESCKRLKTAILKSVNKDLINLFF